MLRVNCSQLKTLSLIELEDLKISLVHQDTDFSGLQETDEQARASKMWSVDHVFRF